MKLVMKTLMMPILISLLAISLPAQAQQAGITGNITGKVVVGTAEEPVSYATVVALDQKTSKQINGNITEENGKFKLENMTPGIYEIHISFIGFMEKVIRDVELTLEKPDANLETIVLETDNITLAEVEVVGEAPLVETKVDKIVYNAEKDVTNAGGNATDVLRKVPLLTVDLEGNVSLRGSQNLRILINGKPSGMFASGVADALKMIPADEIKNVEVITSPTAKYDGEGSAGIINIITRKKQVQGFTGSVNGSLGTRQNNGNVSLNAAKGRLGVNASAGFWHSWPQTGESSYLREEYAGSALVSSLQQAGETKTGRTGFFGKAGLIYDFNAYNNISSYINFRGFNSSADGTITAGYLADALDGFRETTARSTVGKTLQSGYDWTTDYRRTFKDSEREFSVAFQLNSNVNNRETSINSSSNVDLFNLEEKQFNDGNNIEYTIQTDYVHPINSTVKLEIGAKGVLRRIDSDYQYELFDTDQAKYLLDPTRTNIFDYNQDVYAGYASFNIKLPQGFDIIAGARYEHTAIKGDFKSDIPSFSNEYANLLPSVIIAKKVNQFSNLKLSYNQRIQRPSLFYINPYREDSDRRNITFGNPELEAETVHQVELGYNTFIKGIVLYGSVFYKNTQNLIEGILDIDEQGVSNRTYQNIGVDNSIGLNLFASATIRKFWTVRGNFNLSTYQAESRREGYNLSNNGVLYNVFTSSSFNFKNGWKAEIFGFFNAPRRTLQGQATSFWMYSLGIQKEIFNKRGSIGIRMVDPFNDSKKFSNELRGSDFYQFSEFRLPFRSFGINFNYRFGKLDFKAKTKNTKIRNSDLKQGIDNPQQSGGNTGN